MAAKLEEDLFEQTGQYEPLTTRLRNILREYKDGVGILKELIQNADDAKAGKVKFLMDWRQGRTGSLFSPGMAECQGPALWAYNDAVFTDDDFENINKLAGETKVENISKIGRFGLGFNAVYHLTDVPSFISREHLVVFDPNTHHLQRHIKDRSRPGIRINLSEKPESLTRYQDQFQPYNGVFGCNTTETREEFYYDETLFRFPFRTAAQARTSDISKTSYGRDKIQAIVRSICECASNLLIFSQHVKEVEIFKLDGSDEPDEMRLVLSVKKPSVKVVSQEGVKSKKPFIKQCSKWWKKYRESQKSCSEFPSSCELVNIVTTKEQSELSRCERRYRSDQTWLVVSTSGTNDCLKIARSQEGKACGFLPCGGAAFVVSSNQNSNSDLSGELFCFLPLSITTGLPVHVNGFFAMMSNRVEIWKRSTTGNQPVEVKWNEALMEDALARAYIMLLENLKDWIGKIKDYEFYSLWPSSDTVDMKSWAKLVQKICSVLLDPNTKLFYSDGHWMSIDDGLILSDDFTGIYKTAVKVLTSLGIHVIYLPPKIFKTLAKFDQGGILERRTLSFTQFMKSYFFANIRTLSRSRRDAIVCFGLDRIMKEDEPLSSHCLHEIDLFKANTCISVSQKEETLSRGLFSEQDHRFPVGHGLRTENRLYVLESLGMVKDLDWAGIHERAQSVAKTRDLERCRKLIIYINKRIDELPLDLHRSLLQHVKFLPVSNKPVETYLLPWKGSITWPSLQLSSSSEIFLPKDAKLVGSSCLIVNTSKKSGCGKLSEQVKKLLGFSSRRPEDKFVIQQLDEAIKFWSRLTENGKKEPGVKLAIESICQKIYEFFNHKIVESSLSELSKRNCLFLQGKFVRSNKVAYTSKVNGAPFLFSLPSDYKRDYRILFEKMQIKDTFDDEDYISALYELENTKRGSALSGDELQTAIFFIGQIDVQNPAVKDYIGEIPLPDTDSILRRSKDVVVNLSLWLEHPEKTLKVHEKVPPHKAHDLGAKSLKKVILKKYSRRIGYGESFGQHEELTERLKGILDGYPADGILKELVQNADDAQASEIHFIHDTRRLKCQKVVVEGETSAEVQGPALCVYNDRPFTDKDLEGIKNLGIGSKRDTPGMTGKYGIGFNSVYHLTDCPSFLSNDDTLVFLDPHSRYFDDDDRGQIFKAIDARFRDLNSDTLDGYLPGKFILKGSTMFRFPLRQERNESKISNCSPDVENLFQTMGEDARKSLLFLNNIKKITLSKIHLNGRMEEIFCVKSVITPEDERKRRELGRKACDLKNIPTAEIGWEGVNYTLKIYEDKKKVEKWLVQRCIGSIVSNSSLIQNGEIPDGRNLGLLPRGGIAARLWNRSSFVQKQSEVRGIVYCFLPLPQNYTNLPVHVNGHFALDSTRRGLWTDTNDKGIKCEWNNFMKTSVLPRAYADLIIEARKHLCDSDDQLSRYHSFFPRIFKDSAWAPLAIALYRHLGQTRASVLPLLVPTKSEDKGTTELGGSNYTSNSAITNKTLPARFNRPEWLPADQAYFTSSPVDENTDFLHLLLRIGLPVLLQTPYRIYDGFRFGGVTSNEVSPNSVIGFLKEFNSTGSSCKIGNLPKKLQATVVKSVSDLLLLIKYCRAEENFGKQLKGLPLLLTHDGYLRIFESCHPVFRSTFGDLIPTRSELFIHSEIVHQIPSDSTESEEDIVRSFTEKDLAQLLPHVFTGKMSLKAINCRTWTFPTKGILSEHWFRRLWKFLQNYANPESCKDYVPLNCLLKWPIIPTTGGKLVTIRNAKSILDMTALGNESAQQEKVRQFLMKLKCPVLNKEITFQQHSKNVCAITDSYVGHPYNASDVLIVLCDMLRTNELSISKVSKTDIRGFLRFVQDDYDRLEDLEQCKRMIKELPFHKALDGQFVSLIGSYSSYALVPSGVPVQQLNELQSRAECLFLNSDVLFTLERLYIDLGVRGGQNVTQFYVEYVFRYFKIFTRESQLEHLRYIKDNVFPSFPQGGSSARDDLLKSMKENPCIPDENGRLHLVANFFDPKNELFKVMFVDDLKKFPPPPFNDENWLQLLREIGLKVAVTPQLFLQFCTTVAEYGRRSPINEETCIQSRELVKCLFTKRPLQKEAFLSEVSQIKFIASAVVEDELALIHEQYQRPQNSYPPFIAFRDAVPWDHRLISWTTVPLLPDWAQPNNITKLNNLGIAYSGPEYIKVLNHLQNIVNSPSLESVDGEHCEQLKEITKLIYRFLSGTMECCGHNPDGRCTEVCLDIGNRLRGSSCIFLQKDKTFVNAELLVFKASESFRLKPFLFPVPDELREFQHFFKRLGATDRPTPQQIAYVLRSVHTQIGEGVLSSDQKKKVVYSMYQVFHLIQKGASPDGIEELYLPSESGQLLKSSEMICKVSPRFTEVIKNLQLPILLQFEECGLKKPADSYIDALPKHLTPIKFDDVVREEVASECKSSKCSEARSGAVCRFQEQFQDLLRSDEFQEGLKRLLVHNQQNPQEFEKILKRLQTNVTMKCIGFEKIRVNVIERGTSLLLDNLEKSCYAVQEDGDWSLYMQHDLADDGGKVSTAACVNKILEGCIKKENGLTAMLNCKSAGEISVSLNNLDITQSTSRSADDFTEDEMDSESDGEHGDGGDGGGFSGAEGDGIGRTSYRRGKKRTAQSHGGYSIGPSHGYGDGEYSSFRDDTEDEKIFPKDSREAMRWLRQSRSDLNSARWLLKSGPPYNAHACFQSHQVVEKSLKALLFHHCGISGSLLSSHDVVRLASKFTEETGLDGTATKSVTRFVKYYLNTRYPNRQPFDIVPCDAFSDDEAKTAVEEASKLFDFAAKELNDQWLETRMVSPLTF
ncbi:sacsin-like [Dendronephthya gigantea]|uniref:sacsin-like n=1 Tax=Dendronephthya gigantea TaxID=151771 RepID=UPI00106CEEA5|nr:sacsin-like [Dendronephthya gigantea]